MPIYEYKCLDCGITLEKRQSISEEPLTLCDACGGRLEKQWSLSGFQFKGAGWYVTDYAGNKPSTAGTAANGEKKSAGESTSAGDAASKPKADSSAGTVEKKTSDKTAKKD